MLSQDETLQLINQAQQGESFAKDILLKNNYPLIKSIVKRFLNKGVEYDDLYQLGCVGFLKAIKNFDSSFNVKFSTYSVPMIVGEIKRFLRDDGSVKVARSLKNLNVKINRLVQQELNEHNRSLTIEELSEILQVDKQEILLAIECNLKPISLSESLDDDSDLCIEDRLEAPKENFDMEILLMLKDEIKRLEGRDKKIIILRYYRNMTQIEVSKLLNISQVQVSRLENKIIEKMRMKFFENQQK
jgi:RNA polymerase sporulation-specific sigma factor